MLACIYIGDRRNDRNSCRMPVAGKENLAHTHRKELKHSSFQGQTRVDYLKKCYKIKLVTAENIRTAQSPLSSVTSPSNTSPPPILPTPTPANLPLHLLPLLPMHRLSPLINIPYLLRIWEPNIPIPRRRIRACPRMSMTRDGLFVCVDLALAGGTRTLTTAG